MTRTRLHHGLGGSVESTAPYGVSRNDRPQTRVDCAVVIVTYNSAQHIMSLVDSLPAAGSGLTLRPLVIDNGSIDDTVELVRAAGIPCIETGANLGYAGAINVGREHARPYSAVLILNPDVELEPHAIRRLYAALDGDGIGVSVPKLVDATGALYPSLRREPSLLRALGDAAFGGQIIGRPGWLTEIVWDRTAYDVPHSVDWATGAAIMVSESCDTTVGPWDERFFLYSEETDFAARVRRSGFTIQYMPSARALHHQGGSGSSEALTMLMAVNRVRYYEKHRGGWAATLFRGAVFVHAILRVYAAAHRKAAFTLLRRSTWAQLQSGIRSGKL